MFSKNCNCKYLTCVAEGISLVTGKYYYEFACELSWIFRDLIIAHKLEG